MPTLTPVDYDPAFEDLPPQAPTRITIPMTDPNAPVGPSTGVASLGATDQSNEEGVRRGFSNGVNELWRDLPARNKPPADPFGPGINYDPERGFQRYAGPSPTDVPSAVAQNFFPGLTQYLTSPAPSTYSMDPNASGKIPQVGGNPNEAGALNDVANVASALVDPEAAGAVALGKLALTPAFAAARATVKASNLAAKGAAVKAPDALQAFADVTGRSFGSSPTDLALLGRGDMQMPPGISLQDFNNEVAKKVQDVKQWNNPQRRFWYENSGKEILNTVGGDPEAADRVTATIAKTSQQAKVLENAAFTARAHSQALAGEPISAGRFPNSQGKIISGYYSEQQPNVVGPKIEGYLSGFRTAWQPGLLNEGANDIHNMRWLGYGDNYQGTPVTSQHNYDRLIRSAVTDRLNAEGFDGGGWVPGQVQAVGWAKSRAAGGIPEEIAGYDITHAFRDRTARLTYESAPGKSDGHLPEYHTAPLEDKEAFHHAMNDVLIDRLGRDVIASHFGLLTRPSEHGVGVYEGAVNPGTHAQVVTGNATGGWQAGMDPNTREMLQAAEFTRGLLLRQDAVAYHFPQFPKTQGWDTRNLFDVRTGAPMTVDEAHKISQVIAKHTGSDFFSPIFTGQGYRFINVPEFSGVKNQDFAKGLNKALDEVYGDRSKDITVGMGYNDGFYHPNDWSQGPNGYIQGLAALRPGVQRRAAELLATLGPRVAQVEDEFAGRLGWTPNRATRIWETHPELQAPDLQVNAGAPRWPWSSSPPPRSVMLTPIEHNPFQ